MTDTAEPDVLDLDALRAQLRARPDIVTADAQLMEMVRAALASDSVVDLSSRQRRRVEAELARVQAANAALIELSKANLAAQAQCHNAVLAVLESETLSALDRKLDGRVSGALSVDKVRVLIEGCTPLAEGRALIGCAPDLVDALIGAKAERLGPVDTRFADAVYGPQGPGLRSEALVRMDIAGHPAALCLAARDQAAFTPDMGADLLHFLARVLERRIAPWLRA